MKKITLMLLLIIAAATAYSQKVVRNETDEFTGNKVIETDYFMWYWTGSINVYLKGRKVDDRYLINLAPTVKFSIFEGNELMFKLKNGSVITITALNSAVSIRGGLEHGKLQGSNVQGVNVQYELTAEQYKALLENEIDKIRIYGSGKYHDDNINQKADRKFKEMLNLLK